MKTYRVVVTETYSTSYIIDAYDEEEAYQKAEEMAVGDLQLPIPENMDKREIEVQDVQDVQDA